MSKRVPIPIVWQYVLIGFLLWVLVDFGTAGGFQLSYFAHYGFALLPFYLGYPLVFSWLIFRWGWSESRLWLATLAAIFLIEVVFTGNPLLTAFPALIFGIPLAIMIYAPLTFFPLWFVRKEIAQHKVQIVCLSVVECIVMILATFGKGQS